MGTNAIAAFFPTALFTLWTKVDSHDSPGCMNDSLHRHIRTPLPPVLLPKKYTFINHVCLHTCYKKEHRDISVCEATCRLANAYYSRLTARHTKLRELAQLEAHAQLGRMETLRPECRGNWGSSDVHYNCVRANAIWMKNTATTAS
jgi:hypothetical protein